jgi:hypothetical protein
LLLLVAVVQAALKSRAVMCCISACLPVAMCTCCSSSRMSMHGVKVGVIAACCCLLLLNMGPHSWLPATCVWLCITCSQTTIVLCTLCSGLTSVLFCRKHTSTICAIYLPGLPVLYTLLQHIPASRHGAHAVSGSPYA